MSDDRTNGAGGLSDLVGDGRRWWVASLGSLTVVGRLTTGAAEIFTSRDAALAHPGTLASLDPCLQLTAQMTSDQRTGQLAINHIATPIFALASQERQTIPCSDLLIPFASLSAGELRRLTRAVQAGLALTEELARAERAASAGIALPPPGMKL